MSAIEMRGIVKRFGPIAALDHVDIEIRSGEIHAILGENGAGKSTLMHVLSGSLRADEGGILVEGKAVRIHSPRAARRLGIAMVRQHFTLVPAFTVAENLALDAREMQTGFSRLTSSFTYSPRREAAPALERADALGWSMDPETVVSELPVGSQQRVEIVKALATGARTIIFDEPTAVLAGSEVEELFGVLKKLRSEGAAVVLITHKLAEILATADRVTVLRHGKRIATAPRETVDAPILAGWMMGVSPESFSAPVADPGQSAVASAGPPFTEEGSETELRPEATLKGIDGEASKQAARAGLIVDNISVSGDRGEQAIRGVSLRIGRGEILGIGGVDGNGQAEIAEAIVGLRQLDSGRLEWDGNALRHGLNPSIGYIPQDRRRSGLAVTMSVEENLMMEAVGDRRMRHGPFLRRRALHEMAIDLVQRFDIRISTLDLPVSSLSGGNQQKVVVARALRSRPDLIVAVNPTRGLDIGAAHFVHSQLRQSRDRGAAILLISTDLDEVAALSDRAAILASGALSEYRLDAAPATETGLLLGGMPAAGLPTRGTAYAGGPAL